MFQFWKNYTMNLSNLLWDYPQTWLGSFFLAWKVKQAFSSMEEILHTVLDYTLYDTYRKMLQIKQI